MNTNHEYKLSRPVLPPLYQLKAAHHALLQGYVEALSAVSRLSFLVGLNEIRTPTTNRTKKTLRNIFGGKFSPFRVFVWKPLVKLYTEVHIQKKLRELISIYSQSKHLKQSNHHESVEYQSWWKEAKEECEQFATTLNSGELFSKTLRFVFLMTLNLLIAAWGANNVSDLGLKIFSAEAPTQGIEFVVKLIIFILFATPLLFVFFESGFTTKREIFLTIISEAKERNSIYQLENNLFDLLARGKSIETPIDFFFGLFFYLSLMAYAWLLNLVWQITVQVGQGDIHLIYYSLCIIPLIIFILFKQVFIPWYRRDLQREA